MIARAIIAALALAIAVPALAQGGPSPGRRADDGPSRNAYANPSAAIAAEIARSRLSQDKGLWTAWRDTAARDALMFAPQLVPAYAWLKGRPNPPMAPRRQPHRAWSSCDGTVMVVTGAWQRGADHGWFTAVWQRQEDGAYKWVFDHEGQTVAAIAEPDMIVAEVADCPPRRASSTSAPSVSPKRGKPAKPLPVPFDPAGREGRSRDGSLVWSVKTDAAGHQFFASLLREGEMREFRGERVPPRG